VYFSSKAVYTNLLVGLWKSAFSKTIWSRRGDDNSSFSIKSKVALSCCNSTFQRPSQLKGLRYINWLLIDWLIGWLAEAFTALMLSLISHALWLLMRPATELDDLYVSEHGGQRRRTDDCISNCRLRKAQLRSGWRCRLFHPSLSTDELQHQGMGDLQLAGQLSLQYN